MNEINVLEKLLQRLSMAFLNYHQAAKYVGMSQREFQRNFAILSPAYIKSYGGTIYFTKQDLDEWIEFICYQSHDEQK